MKKLFFACLVSNFLCMAVSAQEFTVKSFEAKVTDLTAKIDPVNDLNGEPCALIRVAVACRGCLFEGNIVGTPKVKAGEYLVYVPAGTRRLKISHPDFLPLTYEFNLKIEKNCTYELRLTLPQHTTAIPELNSQFLVLSVSPQNAMIFIDDMIQTTVDGVLSKELPFGEHAYRVELPMYHPRRGVFTISPSGRTSLSVTLDPAYGFLTVNSSPESGAQVFVDGKLVGTTPYKSERMASGSYQVQVLKAGYYPQMQSVTVADNRTAVQAFALKANFSQITLLAANPAAEIWVSGKRYGTGRWSGRLDAGTYSVESRCEGYEKALQSVVVEAGEPQTIRLAAQTPIYGILKVNSVPVGATVKIDGTTIGDTPLITNKVLVGEHRVEVSKAGSVAHTRTVAVVKGQTTTVEATLNVLPEEATTRTERNRIEMSVDLEDDVPFVVSETMPSFQGGDIYSFGDWVRSNIRYPKLARENGVQGRVVLSFVIEKDGSLIEVSVLQSPDRSLSEEAVRVVKSSPKWSPGRQRDKPVRVKCTLPVDFRFKK